MQLEEGVKTQIEKLIHDHRVMLFMKGNKSFPQCGFSATVVGILSIPQRAAPCCACWRSVAVNQYVMMTHRNAMPINGAFSVPMMARPSRRFLPTTTQT